MSKVIQSRQSYLYKIFYNTLYANYASNYTCIYLSLDNGVTMASKRRENKNLVNFICSSFLIIDIK